MGVIIGNASETGNSNYPYGAMLLAANASVRRKRIPFLFILLLAILSFFSFSLGLATSSGPSFGVVIYYGSYSPKT